MASKRYFALVCFLWLLGATVALFAYPSIGEESLLAKSDIPVSTVVWSPTEAVFATAWNNAVILWDGKTNEILSVFSEHSGPIKAVHFSADGAFLLTLGQDNMIVVRDVASATGETRVIGSGFAPMHDALLADRSASLIIPRDGVETSLYYRLRLTNRFTSHLLLETDAPVQSLDITKDGERLLIFTQDGTLTLINVKTGAPLATYQRYAQSLIAPHFSPDGKSFIAALDSTSLAITAIGGEDTLTIRDSALPVHAAVFSSDGTRVAYALKNGSVKVINVFSGATIKAFSLAAVPDEVTALTFSLDGASLVAGTAAGSILRWGLYDDISASITFHAPQARDASVAEPAADTVITLDALEQAGDTSEPADNEVPDEAPARPESAPFIHIQAGLEAEKRGERLEKPQVAGETAAENAVTADEARAVASALAVSAVVESLSEEYYHAAFGVSVMYRSYRLYPLYWGVGGEFSCSPPDSDYPYTYTFNGTELNNPWLYKGSATACIGISTSVSPYGVLVFAETRIGWGGKFLFNNELTYSRTSKLTGGGSVAVLMGVEWKKLRLSVGGEYDTNLALMAKAELGVVFLLKK